jgi:hypothetical protein
MTIHPPPTPESRIWPLTIGLLLAFTLLPTVLIVLEHRE